MEAPKLLAVLNWANEHGNICIIFSACFRRCQINGEQTTCTWFQSSKSWVPWKAWEQSTWESRTYWESILCKQATNLSGPEHSSSSHRFRSLEHRTSSKQGAEQASQIWTHHALTHSMIRVMTQEYLINTDIVIVITHSSWYNNIELPDIVLGHAYIGMNWH